MTFRTFLRLFALLLCVQLLSVVAIAQAGFSGVLDGELHVDSYALSPAVLDTITPEAAKQFGVTAQTGDKVYAGAFSLPKGGALKYKAVLVRGADGTDILYIDRNQDGRFGDDERISFRLLERSEDERAKSVANFTVALHPGLYPECPMEVRLMREGVPVPMPIAPTQLAVAYTAQAFVEGHVSLPQRRMLMRFQYDFASQGIDQAHGLEWVDINADGKIDMTPGSAEFLRGRGAAPIFKAEGLTLQTTIIDLKAKSFQLQAVSTAADQRLDLKVGATLPDFEYADLAGVRHHLSEVKGKVRLLDFWATWCVPCIEDMPNLKKAYAAYRGRGFEILAMSGDEDSEKARKFVAKEGLTWTQGRFEKHLFEDRFQITQWPTMILIDEKGVILSMGEKQHLPLEGENLVVSLKRVMDGR